MNYEIIGLIGTLFVLISFAQTDILKIRAINLVGALLFVAYGILIGSVSNWLLNGIIVIIQVYKLIKKK
jgi:hypothetical protein